METRIQSDYYAGQRLSLKSQLCTVRYIGPVAGRQGQYLGVEWDDPTRGKHAGSHNGEQYFKCHSHSPTAASFLKPEQPWDAPRSFLHALTEKYMSNLDPSVSNPVYISGKEAEQVGFEKFAQRQKQLRGIHVVVLDNMRIRHDPTDNDESSLISELCAEITDLDLSYNLFESLGEILDLARRLPKLRRLTLDGNRFNVNAREARTLPGVRSLNLRSCLLDSDEIGTVVSWFPSVEALALSNNEISSLSIDLPTTITTLDVTDNAFTLISELEVESPHPNLNTIILKRNKISGVGTSSKLCATVRDLDVSYNSVTSWTFFDDLNTKYSDLRHLRVTGNPLYKDLKSADGKPLTAADGYILTIARLPGIETLNYSRVTDKERLNAETYYLGQIAHDLSSAPEIVASLILAKHPRYHTLCEEYGEPSIQRRSEAGKLDPDSLAARLINIDFVLAPQSWPQRQSRIWTVQIPKSFTVYMLLGYVAKCLSVGLDENPTPADLRLLLESNEVVTSDRDSGYAGPECWDSEDEDEVDSSEGRPVHPGTSRGLFELVPGTRMLATYIEGSQATIQIEDKQG